MSDINDDIALALSHHVTARWNSHSRSLWLYHPSYESEAGHIQQAMEFELYPEALLRLKQMIETIAEKYEWVKP